MPFSMDSLAEIGISFEHHDSFNPARDGRMRLFPPLPIPRDIRLIAERVEGAGRKAYIVGGALRDHFMKRGAANDFDMATDASPQEILSLFPHVIPTGIKHGTVTVLSGRHSVEITTFRVEGGYTDGRRPDAVEFVATIDEDLSRRDFTMNAMAYEILSGRLHDPFDGRKDIGAKLIRTVGAPGLRFAEDGLRPLRAIRFASQLGFAIDDGTFSAIGQAIATFRQVSPERVRDELQKILLSPSPSTGLRLLESSGLLGEILPELTPSRGCQQKGLHRFDVMDHLFLSVDASRRDLVIRLAALFHDSGKPSASALGSDGIPTFHNHEQISVRLASSALRRLKLPNETIDSVLHLVKHHMFNYTEDWTDSAVRRFIARVGADKVGPLFDLRMADSAAIAGAAPDPRLLEPFRRRISALQEGEAAFRIGDLAVNGNDLAGIGIPKGPVMGRILAELLETVLDDPEQNRKEALLVIASALKSRYGIV